MFRVVPFVILLLLSGMLSAATIFDVRLSDTKDKTRVTFDLSGPVKHKVMTLTNPHRIVVDISNAKITADLAELDMPKASPLIQLRSGVRNQKDLRVVIDLSEKVRPSSQFLKADNAYGDRLLIDLTRVNPQQLTKKITQSVAAKKKRKIIIAIDAGHGGIDPGALGPNGLLEKDVVLAIAKKLEAKINAQPGYNAVMVRSADYFVKLGQRRRMARHAQADLMLSIHADAFSDAQAHGASVYALSTRGASSATARFLANKANNSDLVGGVSLKEKDSMLAGVLADLSMTASMDMSLKVGAEVLQDLGHIARLHSKKVGQAAFAVLKSPDVPSILVETGFISNPDEAKKLSTKAYQEKMANAIYQGIHRYFSNNPPADTMLAWKKDRRQLEIRHVVSRGESLSVIAANYGISESALRKRNGISKSAINIGQILTIPVAP